MTEGQLVSSRSAHIRVVVILFLLYRKMYNCGACRSIILTYQGGNGTENSLTFIK